MASIITATTSSGLTQSADLSGVLQLASGTGNLVTVPAVTGTAMVSGNMPAFSAYKSAAQTLSSATFTKITFDLEEYDTNNNFASSAFTPTVAGYYQVNAAVNNGTGVQTVVSIYKNGSESKAGSNSSAFTAVASAIIYMNGSTDYLEIYGYFAVGTATGSGTIAPFFQACLLRTA